MHLFSGWGARLGYQKRDKLGIPLALNTKKVFVHIACLPANGAGTTPLGRKVFHSFYP